MVPKLKEKISEFNKIVSEGFTEEELNTLDNMLYRLTSNAVKHAKNTEID